MERDMIELFEGSGELSFFYERLRYTIFFFFDFRPVIKHNHFWINSTFFRMVFQM